MKTITITTDEYDKLKADKKAAEMIIAELLGTFLAVAKRVSITHPVLREIDEVLDNAYAYLEGVKS